MGQSCVALLGKGTPFPAQRALPWPISGTLSATLFPAWTTSGIATIAGSENSVYTFNTKQLLYGVVFRRL